jgi:hypothetical protein
LQGVLETAALTLTKLPAGAGKQEVAPKLGWKVPGAQGWCTTLLNVGVKTA